ncbi:MAG: metallophosphoesterase [Candidatus Aminicenantes bacterium]|nr:metallophosphoesterase [Candidatus Aminicenantes bacterium]
MHKKEYGQETNKTIKITGRYIVVFLFIFIFLIAGCPLGFARSQGDVPCIWNGIDKIIAIGDLHGDYENFIIILKGTFLVNEDLNWIGGKTHLVQTGDVLDRGPNARKIFDLLKKLEKEAKSAGGKVHMLLGNHEEMNIVGIAMGGPGYVPVEQFISFLTEDFRDKHEKKIREKFIRKNNGEDSDNGLLEAELKQYWQNYIKTHKKSAEEAYFVGFNELYGDWLLEHDVVIKINDIVFSHGGISEKFSKWDLEKINERYREELIEFRRAWWPGVQPAIQRPEFVYNPQSPMWYRELALGGEEEFEQTVDRILVNLKARYIVIAHTPRLAHIQSRFGDRVWLIDTGISRVYGGNATALVIEDGKFSPWEFIQ